MPPRKTAEPAARSQAPKKPIDWEAIERDYRAGIISVRALASAHGISEAAIRKRAKADGWQRDLTDQVREAVRTKLVRTSAQCNASAQEIVDAASDTGVAIVREHRSDINRGRKLVLALMRELDEATTNIADIEDAIEEETGGDKNPTRKAMMQKAVALPSRASVISSLSSALKNLVALERQAFSLDETKAPEGDDSEARTKAQQIADALREIEETTGKTE